MNEQPSEAYLRDPICTNIPYNLLISIDNRTLMTLRDLYWCKGPECAGYWQDLKGLQNLPSFTRWFEQTVMVFITSGEISNNPDLARISCDSVKPDFERWQLDRWSETSSVQSKRLTTPFWPRSSPQDISFIPKNEQLSSIFTKLSDSRELYKPCDWYLARLEIYMKIHRAREFDFTRFPKVFHYDITTWKLNERRKEQINNLRKKTTGRTEQNERNEERK